MKRVFIDGQVGTTGLQIHERLSARSDIELVSIEEEKRKDVERKREIINSVDLAILCLPEGPSIEAASLVENDTTRIIDASTAHRVADGWVYGFPELDQNYRERVANAQKVANPGCHATGFIAAVYPLVKAGIIPADYPLSATSLTGFSGGGKQLIAAYNDFDGESRDSLATRPYALGLTHKHLPEMAKYTGIDFAPVFYPVVGDFNRGMLVSIPLQTRLLNKKVSASDVRDVLAAHYEGQTFVQVKEFNNPEDLEGPFLDATKCNDTNRLDLFSYGHDDQIMLVARLDNLGKGASGAAVQNMNIMLGLDETTGLTV